MPSASGPAATATVALIGNPNTGKSTLFNALCGLRQRVGNYPGVTVEKKVGRCEISGREFRVLDLPGSYSLAPRSPDEMVAVEVLLGSCRGVEPLDAVLCIVDASNLERNLYLVSQVLELGLPTIVALNMVDLATAKGVTLDLAELQRRLGVPVVPIQAHRKQGIDALRAALVAAIGQSPALRASPFPPEFQAEVARLEQIAREANHDLPRYLAERLLLDTSGYLTGEGMPDLPARLLAELPESRSRLETAGCPVPAVEAMSRYQWVGEITHGVVQRQSSRPVTWTDKLDRLLTHRVWGVVAFVLIMLALFQSVFHLGDYGSSLIESLIGAVSSAVAPHLPEGPLRSLLLDGILEGVGGVVTFLPQILVLFFFIGVLEDCGYMARAAYLMDRLMSRLGLSGKSFIPLLSSFACAIPGIMSARVIENPRDRLLTILVAPLMSCSARLPVYTLMVEAFIPDRRWSPWLPGLHAVVMTSMYFLGIVAAVVVTLVLRRTILRGPTPPFVMELPSYKLPGFLLVAHRMAEAGWSFLARAGTLILAVSIVVWAAAYYPRSESSLDPSWRPRQAQLERTIAGFSENSAQRDERAALQTELTALEGQIEGQFLRDSYLGRAGTWIEPVVRPLGWDWRLGCAAIASFPAREVVVATLGVLFNLGSDQDEASAALQETLQGATWDRTTRLVFTIPVALSVMVFFSLCAQCVSTLVVMRKETGSWRWPALAFVYMTLLAYFAAFATFQLGSWMGW